MIENGTNGEEPENVSQQSLDNNREREREREVSAPNSAAGKGVVSPVLQYTRCTGWGVILALIFWCAIALPCSANQIGCTSVVMSGPGYIGLDDNHGNPLSANVLVSQVQANVMAEPFTLTATISCAPGPSWTGEAVVALAQFETESSHAYTPFSVTPASTWITVPGGGSKTVSFTFNGLPDSVQPLINTVINIGCYNPQIRGYPSMLEQTQFDIYTTHYLPEAPQQRPFLGVISDACNWAVGTTQYGATEAALTEGLYYSQYITYDAKAQFTQFTPAFPAAPTGEIFLLTQFLYGRPTPGSCYDVANYLLCCANALGLQCTCDLINNNAIQQKTLGQSFVTNPIYLIGSDPSNGYTTPTFYNHQVLIDKGGNVCDASLAMVFDLAGTINRPIIPPTAWQLLGYWQTPSTCACPTENTGLVNTPIPSAPNIIISHCVPVISTDTNIIG